MKSSTIATRSNYANEIGARAMYVNTNIADFWIINTSLFLTHANTATNFPQKYTFVLTLVDMTGKIGDHNLLFGRDREKLTGKLGIRIPRAAEEQILLQIPQFRDLLCPPCHWNFGLRLQKFPFLLQYFPRYSSVRSRCSQNEAKFSLELSISGPV